MSFPGQDIRKIYMDEILRLEEEGSVFRVFMNARPAISSGYLRAQVWFELPDGGVARRSRMRRRRAKRKGEN